MAKPSSVLYLGRAAPAGHLPARERKQVTPLRILHTVQFYWPHTGGAEEVVREISERLVARGHDVTVATTALPERTSREHAGVKIVEFPLSGNLAGGFHGDVTAY